MTQAQAAAFSKALTRAQAQGVSIICKGTRKIDGAAFWAVQGTKGIYQVVRVDANTLTCTCGAGQAGKYCKHRSIVTARLMEQAASVAPIEESAIMSRMPAAPRMYR